MRPAKGKTPFRYTYRTFVIVLLLMLVLTPACSSICQARTCHLPHAPGQASDCHHAEKIIANHYSSSGSAAIAACGLHELVFAMPTNTQSDTHMKYGAVNSIDSRPFFTGFSTVATGPVNYHAVGDGAASRNLREPAGRHFSFDSFVFLRI